MLNGIQEKELNKNADIKIKLQKYPGASSIDILDHITPSLKKEPDQIVIHEGTNDLTNDYNHLNNVKKIVKIVRETCKKKVKKTNKHLENYYKQQSLDFIDNSNLI